MWKHHAKSQIALPLAFRNHVLLWLVSPLLYCCTLKSSISFRAGMKEDSQSLMFVSRFEWSICCFTSLFHGWKWNLQAYWLTNLYVQQEKLQQTRKLYGTYNALLEIKDLMLKEISLLNSIGSQVKHMRYCLATFCVFAYQIFTLTFRYQVDLRFCFLLLVYISWVCQSFRSYHSSLLTTLDLNAVSRRDWYSCWPCEVNWFNGRSHERNPTGYLSFIHLGAWLEAQSLHNFCFVITIIIFCKCRS